MAIESNECWRQKHGECPARLAWRNVWQSDSRQQTKRQEHADGIAQYAWERVGRGLTLYPCHKTWQLTPTITPGSWIMDHGGVLHDNGEDRRLTLSLPSIPSISDEFAFRPTGSTTAALITLLLTITTLHTTNPYVFISLRCSLAHHPTREDDSTRHSSQCLQLDRQFLRGSRTQYSVQYNTRISHSCHSRRPERRYCRKSPEIG